MRYLSVEIGEQLYKIGLLFRLGSFWVGVHYSPQRKRVCINVLPCITVWIVMKGGDLP